MTSLDWLILAPVIPLAPVAITWWLPWEFWIPWHRISKRLLAPYLFYLTFVAWHFALHPWTILILGLSATWVSFIANRKPIRKHQTDDV